ncbi:helix-turn-helix domain-containing protein [Lactonifactor longoviformis]|uniref:PucR family transcriptional regulator n=1 Tax=Lactonifactor longoviformis TaxID=341220 RepID=UPI00210A9F30|nr:helix-turn-helix domain-containing protein [Lactonifactor longoviformis]MCQ4671246.1 helix-turn-helix domain-containing protein [Lactonifactor longoviformis]
MNLPLITLLDRMNLQTESHPVCPRTLMVKGIRFLSEHTERLKKDYLYIGPAIPKKAEYERGTAALVCKLEGDPGFFAFQLSEGEEVSYILNQAQDVLEEMNQWEEQLKELIYGQKGLQEMIQLFSKIMGNPAYLVDSSFKVLAIDKAPVLSEISAIWKHLVTYGYLSYDILDQMRRADEIRLMDSYEKAVIFHLDSFNNPFINYNLRWEGKIRGHLFIVGYFKKITPGDEAYADYLGRMVLLALEKDMKYSISRGKDYENFIHHVVSGTLKEKEEINRQLAPLMWDMEGRYCVMRYLPEEEDEIQTEVMCAELENMHSSKPVIMDGEIVTIFSLEGTKGIEKLEKLLEVFVEKNGGYAGLSDEFDGFYRSSVYYRQALICLDMGRELLKKPFVSYRHYAVLHLLFLGQKNVDMKMVCDKAVFRLLDYDREHHTEYCHTLEVYIRNERNIGAAAEELYIHRNTLLYRIARLKYLTGVDLDDYQTRVRLGVSFYIVRYLIGI